MGWLSLCVCGTKKNFNNEKAKKSGRHKKYKKSKKHFEQENVSQASPFIDESLRKLQDERQVEKEIAKEKWTNASVADRFDDRAKNQIDGNGRVNPTKIDDLPNDPWSYQIKESRKNSERSVDESDREARGIDYNAVLPSRCASSTTDEKDEKQVNYILDKKEYDEKILDESVSTSVASGEPDDLSWTSEIENKQNVIAEPNINTKSKERVSSRINFFEDQESSKGISSRKQSRNVLPPIKGRSCAETRNCLNEKLEGHKATSKFGFKKTPVLCEQREIRRKVNSCSFEIRPFENEERGGKARTRGEGSMIPRLAFSTRLDRVDSIKSDGSKSKIVQNGTS